MTHVSESELKEMVERTQMRKQGYVIKLNDRGNLYYSNIQGYIVGSGRSLDKGFLTPVLINNINEAKQELSRAYNGMPSVAYKKYLFRTERAAIKWWNETSEILSTVSPSATIEIEHVTLEEAQLC